MTSDKKGLVGTMRYPANRRARTGGRLIVMAAFALSTVAGTFTLLRSDAGASELASIDAQFVEHTASDTLSGIDLSELSHDVFGVLADDAADGTGVDVALIDTGVAPVEGLGELKVLHGPDLSSEAGSVELATVDTNGHGTHLAGIIAGDRAGAEGLAPGARIVSVKVAGRDGKVGLDQLLAAIDWVIDNRDSDGLNIRVLNFSYGVSGVPSHVGDPLSAALERAWDAGILVVVSAGNEGAGSSGLSAPGLNPYLLSVASVDSTVGIADAELEPTVWSSHGDGVRDPDLAAPGRSIASYRVVDSAADIDSPTARVGDDLFLGSGTSQSAAVVSGVAARLLERFPAMTPDQVKSTLTASAVPSTVADSKAVGHGVVDGAAALASPFFTSPDQSHLSARGPQTGAPAQGSWDGGSWDGGSWDGGSWDGGSWDGGSWDGGSWDGGSWDGGSWDGGSWDGGSWDGGSWDGGSWDGGSWD